MTHAIDWASLAPRYEAGETYEQIGLDVGVDARTCWENLHEHVNSRRPGQQEGVAHLNDTRGRDKPQKDAYLKSAARIARPNVSRMFR